MKRGEDCKYPLLVLLTGFLFIVDLSCAQSDVCSSSIRTSHSLHLFLNSVTIVHNFLCISLLLALLAFTYWKVVMGSLAYTTNLSVCCAHKGKTDTDKSAPVVTQLN